MRPELREIAEAVEGLNRQKRGLRIPSNIQDGYSGLTVVKQVFKTDQPSMQPALVVSVITIASLLPFITKAFNIDDTLFLWAARQIHSNPVDFFGFNVNWYGTESAMSSVTKNPPFVSYYIALITKLFGWREPVVHLFFLVPAAGLSLGVYYLARLLCPLPQLAALLAVFSPAFLVSSTTVMSDTTMLALYVWGVLLWLQGLEKKSPRHLLGAALLIALSTLTKYFGATAIPLLLAYTLVERKRFDSRLLFLLIPVIAIIGYEGLSKSLYGQGLFYSAMSYESNLALKNLSTFLSKTLLGLSFTGGCFIGVLFFAPLLWSRLKGIALTAALFTLTFAVLLGIGAIDAHPLRTEAGIRWGVVIQLALFIPAGVLVFVLALRDTWEERDAASVTLLLWLTGTFVFASYVNWSVNARSVFPMVPAAAILLVRRMPLLEREAPGYPPWQLVLPLALSAVIALSVAWADFSLANSQRSAVERIHAKAKNYSSTIWFEGHWGFQYYMESFGYSAVDFKRPKIRPGDLIIVPLNNTNTRLGQRLASPSFRLIDRIVEEPSSWASVLHPSLGAGFYSHIFGPLPYAFGKMPPEPVAVFLKTRTSSR